MTRSLRIEFEGAWHHVMHRGAGHQAVYLADADRTYFQQLLGEVVDRFGVEVHSFCLMTNHYHLLVRTPEANLGRAMRHLNGVYTQQFNRRHERDGALFRGRYASRLVADDTYLMWVARYIHRNPVEAAIVSEASSYQWSSMPAYAGRTTAPAWLTRTMVLGFFDGNPTLHRLFVDGDCEDAAVVGLDDPGLAVLGAPSKVVTSLQRVRRHYETEPGRRRTVPVPHLSDIDDQVCRAFGVDQDSLHSSRKGRPNVPRQVAVGLGQTLGRATQTELAAHYGFGSYKGVASAVRRFDALVRADPKFALGVQRIATQVAPLPRPS